MSTNAYDSNRPSFAASGTNVYVAWSDNTPVPGSGGSFEVWMRVSNNNGGSFGSAIRMSTNTYDSEYPSVAAAGNNAYIAWCDDTPVTGSGSSYEIWLRASSDNGVCFGSAVRISTNTGTLESASVAAIGGYVYVAWQGDMPVPGSGTATETCMRVSSNHGASFSSAIRISTNTGWSQHASVVASEMHVAWDGHLEHDYESAPET